MAAMLMRLALLLSIAWWSRLTQPLFTVLGEEISGRDLILIAGGLFLLAKATYEIHDKLEGHSEPDEPGGGVVSERHHPGDAARHRFLARLGHHRDRDVDDLGVMVTAVVLAVLVMLVAAEPISVFVEAHPTVKILALAFLILIGVSLVADGLGQHISKGYIYFAMGFSVFVEMINIRVRKKGAPVHLHQPYE